MTNFFWCTSEFEGREWLEPQHLLSFCTSILAYSFCPHVFILWSQDGCSTSSIAPEFQAGRKWQGKRHMPAETWKEIYQKPQSSDFSLSSHWLELVSDCHPKLQGKLCSSHIATLFISIGFRFMHSKLLQVKLLTI